MLFVYDIITVKRCLQGLKLEENTHKYISKPVVVVHCQLFDTARVETRTGRPHGLKVVLQCHGCRAVANSSSNHYIALLHAGIRCDKAAR